VRFLKRLSDAFDVVRVGAGVVERIERVLRMMRRDHQMLSPRVSSKIVGAANGIAYDSQTGIACTTTEIDGGVEFYDVAAQTGIHLYMHNGGGQSIAGTYVINDPIHQLFLIAQPISGTSSSGSSIQVFKEDGTFVESIDGFDFTNAGFLVIPVRIAINP
jgi:hypothetical protein